MTARRTELLTETDPPRGQRSTGAESRYPRFRSTLTRRLRRDAPDVWDSTVENERGEWVGVAVGRQGPPVQGDEVEIHFFDARNVRTRITSFDLLEVSATLVSWSVELEAHGSAVPIPAPAQEDPAITEDKR